MHYLRTDDDVKFILCLTVFKKHSFDWLSQLLLTRSRRHLDLPLFYNTNKKNVTFNILYIEILIFLFTK
jgi:hypothetical protein